MIIQKVLKKSNPWLVMSERFSNNNERSVATIGKPMSTNSIFDKGRALGVSIFDNMQDALTNEWCNDKDISKICSYHLVILSFRRTYSA